MGRKLSKPRPVQGARLLALRRVAGLTQTELARLLGVSQANVAQWERSAKPPRSVVLPSLANALGVSVADLLGTAPLTEVTRRPGPVGKLQRVFEQAASLPRRQQQKVVDIVTALVHEYTRKAS